MALLLSNAILHILNNNGTGTLLSNVELETDSETVLEFVGRHVRRLIKAPSARDATFRADSPVYSMVKQYQKGDTSFKNFSYYLAERLYEIMKDNKEIPPGDLLICSFDNAKKRYIAIVKLPYSECYTHFVQDNEYGSETRLTKNLYVLPNNGSKVEEACLIPYDPMVLRITEKAYPVNGEVVSYFSELFLGCDTQMSKKETAEIIQDIATEINDQHFSGDFDMEARIKQALVVEAPEDEDEYLNLENAAKIAYGDNEEAVKQFVERAKDAGLPHDVNLNKAYVQREFKTQKIKADNGIELKIPLEISQNPEAIQIETHHDGSMSITLKHLRNINV